MKQALITVLSALFLFSSCHSAAAPGPQAAPRTAIAPEDFPDFLPTEIEEYVPKVRALTETKTEDGFWDVSDADISAIDPSRKLISFTLDDSPSKTLENILAVFASFNEENPDCPASATLFCNGCYFNGSSVHNLHAAYALGWEMGNHTYAHLDLTTLSDADLQTEIDRTDELLSTVDNKPRHLLRPPFGKADERIKKAEAPVIDWTIDTLDWTGTSSDKIYETVFSQKFDGAIVLMHDGYENTVDALKRLLPDLKAAGYQVTSVSQMAKANDCPLKNGGTYIRARKKS
ncbi:MAG: polysaccharide deacetylase family protein [Clostridia bacterium]|nr:polysaccharide deacetylase family protein [Clostridia bacterium]